MEKEKGKAEGKREENTGNEEWTIIGDNPVAKAIRDRHNQWWKDHFYLWLTITQSVLGNNNPRTHTAVLHLNHSMKDNYHPFHLSATDTWTDDDYIARYGQVGYSSSLFARRHSNNHNFMTSNTNSNANYCVLTIINEREIHFSSRYTNRVPFIPLLPAYAGLSLPSLIDQLNKTPLINSVPPMPAMESACSSLADNNHNPMIIKNCECCYCKKRIFDPDNPHRLKNTEGLPVMRACEKCQLSYYCSNECVEKHWPSHKRACEIIGNMSQIYREYARYFYTGLPTDYMNLHDWFKHNMEKIGEAVKAFIQMEKTIIDINRTVFDVLVSINNTGNGINHPLFSLEKIMIPHNSMESEETRKYLSLLKADITKTLTSQGLPIQTWYMVMIRCPDSQSAVGCVLPFMKKNMFVSTPVKRELVKNLDALVEARNAIRLQRQEKNNNQCAANNSFPLPSSSGSSASSLSSSAPLFPTSSAAAASSSSSSSSISTPQLRHPCSFCGIVKAKSSYSKSQWKSKRFQCIACLDKRLEKELGIDEQSLNGNSNESKKKKKGKNTEGVDDVKKESTNNDDNPSNGKNEEKVDSNNRFECAVCLDDDPTIDEISMVCTQSSIHRLHQSCFLEYRVSCKKFGKELLCPYCRAAMKDL